MRNRVFAIFGTILLIGCAAKAQTIQQLPLEASNCAILRALQADLPESCLGLAEYGQTRGIVLRVEEEIKRAQTPTPAPKVKLKPKPIVTKKVPRKTAPANTGAAKPQNGYFIQFALNSFDLEPEFKEHLGRLAKVLASPALSTSCIRVTGHTDTTGPADHNQELSQKRAIIVATNLSEIGRIDPKRIQIAAKGETEPLPAIDGANALNRRVEFSTKESVNGCSV